LLRDDLAGVEFNKHRAVSLDLFDGHRQAEVVQEKELELQVVEFGEGEAADLWVELVMFDTLSALTNMEYLPLRISS
jgi:hypothetical protein